MQTKLFLLLFIAIFSCSFQSTTNEYNIFQYPNQDKSKLRVNLHGFENFSQEFRGKDYLVQSISNKHISFSILYYVMNKDESKKSNAFFDDAKENEFHYIDKTVTCKEGVSLREFNLYGISKVDEQMFVIVHFSKENYSINDSLQIRKMLHSLRYEHE